MAGRGGYLAQANKNLDASAPKRALIPQTLTPPFLEALDLDQHLPQTREARLVKIPTVKSVAGSDLTVVSPSVKNIYREIEHDQKQEAISKRDEW